MDPQDEDPEARIRELERSLTDQARTSELGATQPADYTYTSAYTQPPTPAYTPPPMPSPFTGGPLPITTQSSTAGLRWIWIVIAAVVIGGMALAAGIFVVTMNRVTNDFVPSTRPSPSRSHVSMTNSPGDRSGAPSATDAPTVEPSIPPPGAKLSVYGSGNNKTLVCNDSVVSVSGFSNTVVITGHCASLTVSGSKNVVTVESTDTINASGFDNRVTYQSGSPQIDKSGEGNVVEQG